MLSGEGKGCVNHATKIYRTGMKPINRRAAQLIALSKALRRCRHYVLWDYLLFRNIASGQTPWIRPITGEEPPSFVLKKFTLIKRRGCSVRRAAVAPAEACERHGCQGAQHKVLATAATPSS